MCVRLSLLPTVPLSRVNMFLVALLVSLSLAYPALTGAVHGIEQQPIEVFSVNLHSAAPSSAIHLSNELLSFASAMSAASNLSVSPCDDFYQYACGGWINATHMPTDQVKYTRSFSLIKETTQEKLEALLDDHWPLLTPFYRSCLNQSAINATGIAPLLPLLSLFNDDGVSLRALFHSFGLMSRSLLIHPLLVPDVAVDVTSPAHQWLTIGQPPLSLPAKSYYNSPTLTMELMRHIAAMLRLAGEPPQSASLHAQQATHVEALIANLTLPPLALRNPSAVTNPTNLTGLYHLAPAIPWQEWLAGLGVDGNEVRLNVAAPPYVRGLNSLLWQRSDIVPLLSSFARWRILHAMAVDLPTTFQQENFRLFHQRLHGQKGQQPRWSYCVDKTVGEMSELSSRLYLKTEWQADKRNKVEAMVDAIEAELQRRLINSTWMDNTTINRALEKLHGVVDNLGGAGRNDTPLYEGVSVRGDTLLDNILTLRAYDARRLFRRLLQPTDRRRWQMAASEQNAYYEPSTNSVNFPAGIAHSPFFSASYPDAVNYGGLGMIVGHELSHGWDDEGRQYDGTGRLSSWWTERSAERFKEKAECFAEQYGNISVATSKGREQINGRLTLGENIADNVGLALAYHAFTHRNSTAAQQSAQHSRIRQLQSALPPPLENDNQLFFLSFAQGWCQQVRPAYAHTSLQVDVHSPAVARVNGPLQNMVEFAEAFQCPAHSAMSSSKRCSLY